MKVRVLGEFEATEDGRSVAPSAAKPRQILALLALSAGQVVPVASLMEELWDHAMPRSAATTLQTYILQLRRQVQRALADQGHADPAAGAKSVLATRYNGYLLDLRGEETDVQQFERLATAGSRAQEANDPEAASRLLGSALALWRGPMLADVQTGPRLAIEVMRLEETRLGILERRIEADLRLGRHHTLLGELAVLAAEHPWHENLHALHMVALYRCGRQWRALDIYQRLRATLVEEFGLEPSARLQHLQRAILESSPELDGVGRWAPTRSAHELTG
ncbi:BTAD domain-containing putative transcriptional regulator [Kitasatospora sp. NPDC059795]|uniref:AfsR/SARP family transcriptional regulator n=1 Tax=Kitasatospora sp. NPDC059795 TaxID=3346949 RepID=UPI0036674D2E